MPTPRNSRSPDLRTCPSCNHPLRPDDAFCSQCGTRVQAPASNTAVTRRTLLGSSVPPGQRTACGSCNSPLRPDELYCPVCGARNVGGGSTAPGQESGTSILRRLEAATRGRFEFIRQLGRGGMGTVYLARELDLDRPVAIKVLSSSWLTDDSMVERFRREAKTIASLRHPSIVHVHGVGRADELHYFIMDFIDGVSVGSLLRAHGPLSVRAVRAILYHVGAALSYAHRPSRGVIHRDIKPGNIMLDTEGNSYLTDFGISKVSEGQSGLTMTGLIMGTPEYMSPEQCRGDKVTYASDQYALGAVVYAMLTGAPPFTGPHYRVLMAHTSEEPAALKLSRPDCPGELANAVMKMLAKPPGERWPDIKDALAAAGSRPMLPDDPVRDEIARMVRAVQSGTAKPRGADATRTAGTDEPGPRDPTWLRILEAPRQLETGDEVELRATAGFEDGSEAARQRIHWESTDPSIVRVDPDTGRLVAVGAGSASVKAMAAGIAESFGIEVKPPRVTHLGIEPAGLSIEAGEAAQLRAEPRSRQGLVLERPILWSSSDPGVASVSEKGVVSGHSPGDASILAHCEGVGGAVTITVVAPITAAVVLIGAPASIVLGQRIALRAEARDRRGQRLERELQWVSSDEAIATVTAGTVEATGIGTVTIAVACDDQSATCSLVIERPPVARVVIDDTVSTIAVEEKARVRATVYDSTGEAVERDVAWTSTEPAILSIDRDGWLQGRGVGTATIVATCEEIEARTEVDVVPIPVARVVAGAPPTGLVEGDTFHLMATPEDALGRALERPLSWSVAEGGTVESLGQGRFRALSTGPAVVRVEADGVETEIRLEVSPPRVARITITGAPPSLDVDEQKPLRARLTDQRGNRIERAVTWSTSDGFVARISKEGVLTGSGPGTATITAESDDVRDTVTVTVAVPPWATVVFKPDDPMSLQAVPPVPSAEPPAGEADGPEHPAERVEAAAASPPDPKILSTQEIPRPAYQARPARTALRGPTRPVIWLVPVVVLGGAAAAWLIFGRGGTTAPPSGNGTESDLSPAATRVVVLDSKAGRPVADSVSVRVGDTLTVSAQPTTEDGAIVSSQPVDWRTSDSTKARFLPGPTGGGPTSRRIVALTAGNVRIAALAGELAREFEVTIVAGENRTASASTTNRPSAAQPPPSTSRPTQTSRRAAGDAGSGSAGRAVQSPPTQPPGTLQLKVNPWGRIRIDGALQASQDKLQVSLPPGRHRLQIDNPNMMPFDSTFQIRSGVTTTIPITLKPRS